MTDDTGNGEYAAAGRRNPEPWPPGVAPWERWQTRPAARDEVGEVGEVGEIIDYPDCPAEAVPAGPAVFTDPEPTGSHTTGELTVAALIARLGGSGPAPAPTRVPTPAPAPASWRRPDPPRPETSGLKRPHNPTAECDTEVFGIAALADLPDLNRVAPPVEEPPRKTAPRRPILLAGRSVAALIAVFSLALTGSAWQWSTSKNRSLNTISALDPDSRDIVDPNGQFGDENFLIVGVDSRAGENSEMGAGDTEDAGGARSDSIILVNIPASRERVVAVSFPRDLAISPLYCQAWNPNTGEYGPIYDDTTGSYGDGYVYTETKLNSTFAFGGPKCLVKAVQKLSGLHINRFIGVDFAGFAKMVDALGGVEVCTTTPLEDYELGTVLAHAGRQVIDGPTALNYVRARQVTTEVNGDYGRIKRQQLFLSSLLRSLISSDTFFSLKKLNNVVNMFIADSYVDNVKTRDLVDLGQSVQGISAGHITFVTVPTGETDENGDEPPRTADVKALFSAIIDDDPLPGEDTTAATTAPGSSTAPDSAADRVEATAIAPESVTVQVSNSTERSGLAAKVSNALEPLGFNTLSPNDYPTELDTTTVFFSPGKEQAAVTLASAFPGAEIKRDTGKGRVVQVVLGADYQAVTTPAPTGTPVSVPLNRTSMSPPTELPEDLTITNAGDTTCE